MKKITVRAGALLLAMVMLFTAMPFNAFADDNTVPVIDVVKVKDATIDIKAGDTPVFTATSAEPELYSTRLDTFERWMDVDTGAYITSSEFYNSRIEAWGGTRLEKFEAGHTYAYTITIQAVDGGSNEFLCSFDENTKLSVNGTVYDVPAENIQLEDYFGLNYQIYFYSAFTVTVSAQTSVDIRLGNKVFTDIKGGETLIVDSLDLSDITVLKQDGVDIEGMSENWSMSTKFLDSRNRGVLEVQVSSRTEDTVVFNLNSHYEDCPGAEVDNFQIFFIKAHMHKYTDKVTKATLTKNGKIVPTCSCGATKTAKAIYSPKTFTLSTKSYTYDGKAKKPTVTVKDSKGNKIAASNYTVTYSNNKNVGNATVKLTFKGNYRGTKTITFAINPKGTTISSLTAGKKKLTVKVKKQTTQTTGYQIQYATNSKFTSAKSVSIGNKTTSKAVSGLKAKQKYFVRVRTYKTVNGTKYYSTWSSSKTVTTKK